MVYSLVGMSDVFLILGCITFNFLKLSFSISSFRLLRRTPCRHCRYSVGDPGEGARPPYFQTKLRSEGPKTIRPATPPPLSKGLKDPPTPTPYIKVQIRHWYFTIDFAIFYRCHSFISSPCRLSLFCLSNVAFSRLCRLLNFTQTGRP